VSGNLPTIPTRYVLVDVLPVAYSESTWTLTTSPKVTLYYEQWIRLLDAAGDLSAFLEGNKSRLKLKNPS
jgi:hypothetical protein